MLSREKRSNIMNRSIFKSFTLPGLIIVALVFSSCATIFNNKQSTVSSSSGAAREVTILENGSVVYKGPLPATINVNGRTSYNVQYKDNDGNSRTLQLQKKISGWFLADVLLIGGWVIDIITGDVMEYSKAIMLPINYRDGQQFLLIDYVPDGVRHDLKVINNIYKLK